MSQNDRLSGHFQKRFESELGDSVNKRKVRISHDSFPWLRIQFHNRRYCASSMSNKQFQYRQQCIGRLVSHVVQLAAGGKVNEPAWPLRIEKLLQRAERAAAFAPG